MARYARGKEFWEINLSGAELHITSKGKPSVRKFLTPEQASAQLAKLVAEQEQAGFQLVVSDQRHPELERAIEAEPEAPGAYEVYADWLEGQGDPRGKLIRMMLAGDGKGAERFLATHVADFLGPLAKHRRHARSSAEDLFTWQFGFIHRAYVNGVDHKEVDKLLAQILEHPSARFLVVLGIVTPWEDAQPMIDVLARGVPRTLRELRISQPRARVHLTEVWQKVPRLRMLSLKGSGFRLADAELSAIEHLEIEDKQFSAETMRFVANAPWPELERLDLSVSLPDEATLAALWQLLARADVPIRHLSIKGTRCGMDLVEAVIASPIACQLVTLNLSVNELDDAAAQALVNRRDRFSRLERFVAYANRLSPAGIKVLGELAESVDASGIRF